MSPQRLLAPAAGWRLLAPLLLHGLLLCSRPAAGSMPADYNDDTGMWANMTTIECDGTAISGEERANCTVTTRNEYGEPTAGAEPGDFVALTSSGLSDPSPFYGGPVHWHVDFATCEAGEHNVSVAHGTTHNATARTSVAAGRVRNFTLDCELDQLEVPAGSTVPCAITTLDACGNPTALPPVGIDLTSASPWDVERLGAAQSAGDSVVPVYAAAGGSVLTPAYTASFRTGAFWTPALNYTERGAGGLRVTLGTANWTESRESSVAIRAGALTAARTRVTCTPAGGLLERHLATCYVTTYDFYNNPQVGGANPRHSRAAHLVPSSLAPTLPIIPCPHPSDHPSQVGANPLHFRVTYLSNPATQLGSDAGPLAVTGRADTFETSFVAVDEGVAGIAVSVAFASDGGDRAVVRGTIQVQRAELVMTEPQP